MKTYHYEGLSSSGAKVEGVVEAIDQQEAVAKAKANCKVVVKVERQAEKNVFNTDISELLGGSQLAPMFDSRIILSILRGSV